MSLLTKLVPNFSSFDKTFQNVGPQGYTVIINLRGTQPELYHTTLPSDWVDEYIETNYVMADPVMQFGFFFQGIKRWSEIKHLHIPYKTAQVYDLAKNYNLNFGGVIAKKTRLTGRKQILSFSRRDREPTDDELMLANEAFDELLSIVISDNYITDRQAQCLELYARGKQINEIAKFINYGRQTVIRDMEAVRVKWRCATNQETVAMAIERRLISLADGPKW